MVQNIEGSLEFGELDGFLDNSQWNPMQFNREISSSSESVSELDFWSQILAEPESDVLPSVTSPAVPDQSDGNQVPSIQTPALNTQALENPPVAEKKGSKKKETKRKRNELPIFMFRTRSESDYLEDGYKWRKYGKRALRNGPYARSYYRCSEEGCCVKKKVQRDPTDPSILMTTYEGKHNHQTHCLTYYVESQDFQRHYSAESASAATILVLRRQ